MEQEKKEVQEKLEQDKEKEAEILNSNNEQEINKGSVEVIDTKKEKGIEAKRAEISKDTEKKKGRKDDATKLSDKDFKILSIKKIQSQDDLLKIIRLVAPGTALRAAIQEIVRAKNGALIVADASGLDKIIEGGFRVNCMFTPQRLVELSKMDGAIILSSDMKKILYANTLLAPSIAIPTRETGTRHKAAERTAIQLKTLTIAVSERRRTVTIYYDNMKYILKNTSEIMRRATESLQILEKQCEIFEELLLNLNVLEFTNLTNLNDVCLLVQRAEIILKISSIIKREIIELGKEGTLIRMRLRELIKDLEKEELLVINDYTKLRTKKTKNLLSILSFEELLEIQNIIISLGYSHSDSITNKGHRILNKTGLTSAEIEKAIKEMKNFNALLETPIEDFVRILKSEKKAIKLQKDLVDMKEQVMLGKKI